MDKKNKNTVDRDQLMIAVKLDTLAAVVGLFEKINLQKDETWFDYKLLIAAFERNHKSIVNYLIDKGCRVQPETRTSSDLTPLHYAVEWNDFNLVRKLLKQNAPIFDKDDNQQSLFYIALQQKKFDIIDVMLLHNTETFDSSNDNNNLALFHLACMRNKLKIIEKFEPISLVNSCADFGIEQWHGYTPLHFAALNQCKKTINYFIENNANIFAKNDQGLTPLHLLFHKSQLSRLDENIINALCCGCTKKYENPIDDKDVSHFHICCLGGSSNVIQFFFDNGVNVNRPVSANLDTFPGYYPLHLAVKRNQIDVIELLLKNGASVNVKSKTGLTPLHIACSRGNLKIVALLLKFHADTNIQDNQGRAPIYKAFYPEIRSSIIKLLWPTMNNKVDLNKPAADNSDKFSDYYLIHLAVNYNKEEIVRLLLKRGTNPNVKSKTGLTPLHIACSNSHLKIVKLLLKFNADISIQDDKGCTPIHIAFYTNKRIKHVIVDLLLSKIPKDVNYMDFQGLSHFLIACTRENASVVEMFLKSEVSVNSRVNLKNDEKLFIPDEDFLLLNKHNYSGYSALHFAVDFNRKDVVLLLLQNGADVNIDLDDRKIKPLHLACTINERKYQLINKQSNFDNNQIQIVRSLLNYKAEVNAKDSYGETPLVYACKTDILRYYSDSTKDYINDRVIDIIQILLDHGTDIHFCSSSKKTILHILSKQEHLKATKLVKLFLSKGIDINAVDEHGLTALHQAVIAKKHDLVRILLNHNAKINAVTKRGMTPLHLAIQYAPTYYVAKDSMVEILLANGCDLNKPNVKGKTPLHTAYAIHNSGIIEQLLQYGIDINSKDTQGNPIVCSLYKDREFDINKLISNHIKKLIVLGLYIDENVMDYYYYNDEFLIQEDEDVMIDYIEEVERMQHVKVDNYSSLYDILFKDENEMAKHVKNNSLKTIVFSEKTKIDFPSYRYLLKLQYKKGIARRALLKPAKDAFDFITDLSWPDSCSEQVFSYLTNKNLVSLIKAKYVKVDQKKEFDHNAVKDDEPLSKRRRLK